MKSYKTTLIGLGVAAANLIGNAAANGKIDWKNILLSVGFAALGIVAKDHDVTGGTKQQ